MSYSSKILHFLSTITMLGLVGCSTGGPTPAPLPTPDITIEISGTEVREFTTEPVYQPNCGGTAEVENEIEKSRAIEYVMEVQDGIDVNANGQLGFAGTDVELGATVARHLGHSYGTVETISRSVIVKAGAGTNMQHYIKQQELWKLGSAKILFNGQELVIPFNFRHDFAIELIESRDMKDCNTLVAPSPEFGPTSTPNPSDMIEATPCFPQVGWISPEPTTSGEWIYNCLFSGEENWVGQTEAWKAANWKRGTSQSEMINIIIPAGATTMGLGCDPCTVLKPDGTTISSKNGDFGSFRPNIDIDVKPGELYKVRIFGGDTCPTRTQTIPPCSPEIYIWFNLP